MDILNDIMAVIKDIRAIPLVQFIVYLLLAFVVAGVAKLVVTKLLKLVKLDKLFDKWGINEGKLGTSMSLVQKKKNKNFGCRKTPVFL